ncbi:MAG: AbrB/MazE/SpoVT family DNA-binding domain-containing protein [Candidatus Limnocylindrales bacterium]
MQRRVKVEQRTLDEIDTKRGPTRIPGRSRISSKNQITLPVAALGGAGLRSGDRVRVEVRGPGELVLIREPDSIARFAGSLTGVYGPDYLEELRKEWA